MIYLVYGENNFAIDQFVDELVGSAAEVERYDGDDLQPEQIPELLIGATLFADQRTIILRDIAANDPFWRQLGDQLAKTPAENTLIIIESTVDKRIKTFKQLQKIAEVKEFNFWREYEAPKALTWLSQLLKDSGIQLAPALLKNMIDRAIILSEKGKPVIDQGILARAVESMRLIDGEIDLDKLEAILPKSSYANVFELLNLAIKGQVEQVHKSIGRLKLADDGHQTVGLICSQVVNLASLQIGLADGVSDSQIAKDIGANPFALSQLKPLAKNLSAAQIANVVQAATEMDKLVKSGQLSPWESIEIMLSGLAINKTTQTR